ncbi:MAG: SUMF1/EgtB/PvdO family nonheme iron enzyme, partial [Lentisphaerae bacterium]|nr:SUMF1/EgtB/PvdO family nonheme iron enzyme [Lentisphaerota bacterium]
MSTRQTLCASRFLNHALLAANGLVGAARVRNIALSLLVIGVVQSALAADPVVSNLSASQRAGMALVDITYDLSDPDSASLTVSVKVSTNNGVTYSLGATNFSGSGYGSGVTPGTGRRIVWDAGADWGGQQSEKVWVKVAANDGSAPPGFVLIPAGSFYMGDALGDGGSEELPTHSVYVSALYMEPNKVTKGKWDAVYAWATNNGYSFHTNASGMANDHPAHTVNWFDCIKWCNARSEKDNLTPYYYTWSDMTAVYRTGLLSSAYNSHCVDWDANGYRLPTEAEWEKAARGGAVGRRFPWSDSDTITHSRANYYSALGCDYDVSLTRGYHPDYDTGTAPYTSPVGSFPANGYGLYDMCGNVRDWCWDMYDGAWYSKPGAVQPDTRGPDDAWPYQRTARGGCWDSMGPYCRVATRWRGTTSGNAYNGMRCVRSFAGAGSHSAAHGPMAVDTRDPGSLQFSASSESVVENAGSVTLAVTRSGGSAGTAAVNYAASAGTAVAGTDYAAKSGTLTWADGDSANKTIAIAILNRNGAQGSRAFGVNLTGASGASLGAPAKVTVTILDRPGLGCINDYDGNGISELAVYDNNIGSWYAYSLQTGQATIWNRSWGWPGAETVPGDYDGDAFSDMAVYDQNTGYWYVWSEVKGQALLWERPWGWPGAETVYGDYDGDAKSDLAVYDQPSGFWYIITMDD